MRIDPDKLRQDLVEDAQAAYFGGGLGAAMIQAIQLQSASPEELLRKAAENRLNLADYEVSSNED